MTPHRGKVILIGAGPGDPELVTLRGKRALEAADVVVYDYLASPLLLDFAPERAERIYVGKMGADHAMEQDAINELLARKAAEGKVVIRLKGGDPFVFGRGAEELWFLAERGIDFEAVPGIPAAVAAASTAAAPLTDRRFNSAVALVTGHESPDKTESSVDWESLVRAVGTIVIYMGVSNLPGIAGKLMAAGLDPETPAVVVERAATPRQRTVRGPVSRIAELAREAGIKPPALTIVGAVNSLAPRLEWFESRPLFGRRVVVTRTRTQSSAAAAMLGDLGADVVQMPTIRVEPPADWVELDREIGRLGDCRWVVFTSANGVEFFFERLFEAGRDARALAGIRLAAVGPATAAALKRFGLAADLQPREFASESLARELCDGASPAGKAFLLPRGDRARPTLAHTLSRSGAEVRAPIAYRTLPAEFDVEPIKAGLRDRSIHAVTFTSSSTAEFFAERIGKDFIAADPGLIPAFSIGPVTTETLRGLGIQPLAQAREHTIPGLINALVEHLAPEGGRTP